MLNNVYDADHWLKIARATRALANRVSFETAKKRLLDLSKDYERLAVRKDERKENRWHNVAHADTFWWRRLLPSRSSAATRSFALVLTVAAIPVVMPTVLSLTIAVGARLLAKKRVIVTRLVAIEELAGVDVLCADKTGTLTQNKLSLGDPFSVNKISDEQVILDARWRRARRITTPSIWPFWAG